MRSLMLAAMGAANKPANWPEDGKTGERLLPAITGDSYLVWMPGESMTVTVEVAEADARGEKLAVAVEGFNVVAGR